MKVRAPHYLLFSEAREKRNAALANRHQSGPTGQWRFVLESVEGSEKLEAVEEEPETHGDRLELLAVVRGLEALDQPSRVTLVTRSRYVARGFRFGLQEWRDNGWKWENYGEYTNINNDDLWRRVDHAMNYHQVECRTWRFDPPHTEEGDAAADEATSSSAQSNLREASPRGARSRPKAERTVSKLARRMVGQLSRWVAVPRLQRSQAH